MDPAKLPGIDKHQLANGERLKDVVRMYRTLRFVSKFLRHIKSIIDKSIWQIEVKYKMGGKCLDLDGSENNSEKAQSETPQGN